MNNSAYQQVLDLLDELKCGTADFFNNEKNQTESIILEYKTSFAYDTALDLCPLTTKDKKRFLMTL